MADIQCELCNDTVDPEESDIKQCILCQTMHHGECHTYNYSRCTTFACPQSEYDQKPTYFRHPSSIIQKDKLTVFIKNPKSKKLPEPARRIIEPAYSGLDKIVVAVITGALIYTGTILYDAFSPADARYHYDSRYGTIRRMK